MNIIDRIKKFFNKIKELYNLAKDDKENRKQFIETVKAELSDRQGFFSQYNIKVDNDNYTQIVYTINIPPEFQMAGRDWQIKDKLDDNSYIVSRYLKTKLGYANNIDGPEYYHIEDPTDEHASTKYIAVWNFVNQLKSKKLIYTINITTGIIITGLILLGLFLFIV